METLLAIDVSGYQDPDKVDYPGLAKRGFKIAIAKLDQYLTEEHIRQAKAAGFEVGGYWWHDPIDDPDYQAGRVLAEVKRLGLSFAALDVEQYWSDWNKFWLYCAKKISLAELPKFSPMAISSSAQKLAAAVAADIKVPWLVYTADWFTKEYAAPILSWLDLYDSWIAQYIGKAGAVTWQQLTALPGKSTVKPLVKKTPKIWQVNGGFVYPGTTEPMDTDLFIGSQADLDVFLNSGGHPAPVPEFTPYLAKSFAYPFLRVRTTPNPAPDNIVGKLYPSASAVLILEEKEGWGRFVGGWISLDWVKKVV